MKRLKGFMFLLLIIIVGLCMVACHTPPNEDDNPSENPPAIEPTEPTESIDPSGIGTAQAYTGTDVKYPNSLWFTPSFDYEPSLDVGAGDTEGVKGLFFDSVPYNGKKTKVAAYIGFPENASATNKVPAIVLVHGAVGTAIPEWVKYWNDLGFAAISIDTEGAEPTEGVCNGSNNHIARNRYDNGALDPNYTAGPGNMAFGDGMNAVENQWLYHATSAVIGATSLISSFDCVDANNVGITGISYGSVISSIAICYDDRLSFAMPVYGGISLMQSCSDFADNYIEPYQTNG